MSTARAQHGARLLVVDDEPVILELLAATLRFAGFDVFIAATSAEALSPTVAGRPDLVLLDVLMPGRDGRAVARKIDSGTPPVIFLTARDSRLVVADLELDTGSCQVWRAGTEVTLTPREFELLRYLMSNAGRVLSRAQILDQVWGHNFPGDGTIIESYVCTLRRKLDRGEPALIHTIRGVGYVLRIPPPDGT